MKQICCFFLIAFGLACSSSDQEKNLILETNNWELVILDSIQVEYLGEVREGIFSNGIGLLKDFKDSKLVKFDTGGNVLQIKEFPNEGPGSIMFLETLVEHKGGYFGTTSFKDIYHFDKDLDVKETIKMPFVGEARGGSYKRRNITV